METLKMHYDKLRDWRVKGKDALVVGHRFLLCHVPLDNPYTFGVDPCCWERKIVDLKLLSFNDIHLIGKEANFRDDAAVARMKADDVLTEKVWMFRTEEEPFSDGREYVNWDHCATYIPKDGTPCNFVLDLEHLERMGIAVIRETSVPFVMDEGLRRDREAEAQWERENW